MKLIKEINKILNDLPKGETHIIVLDKINYPSYLRIIVKALGDKVYDIKSLCPDQNINQHIIGKATLITQMVISVFNLKDGGKSKSKSMYNDFDINTINLN